MRNFFVLVVLAVVSVLLLAAIFSSLGRFVKISDFKNFAEGKISELLQARIFVREVKVGFPPDHIALSGLKINQQSQSKDFYLVDIDKVVFKYNLGRFWTKQFDNPNTVSLNAPQFVFRSLTIPLALLNLDQLVKSGSQLADELHFNEGKVTIRLADDKFHFDLTHIRGKLKRSGAEIWHLALEGRVEQYFEGIFLVEGSINMRSKEPSMRIFLNGLQSTRLSEFPAKDIRGIVQIDGHNIGFENLALDYNRVPVTLNGRVLAFDSDHPELDMKVSVGKEDFLTELEIKGGLDGSSLGGEVHLGKFHFPIKGQFFLTKEGFRMEGIQLTDGLVGTGQFGFREGIYHLYLEKNKQRTDVALNLKSWDIDLFVQQDHLDFFGADLVCKVHFMLQPDPVLWDEGRWAFNGKLKTDYLILDQVPFPDFQGDFHALSLEVDHIHFQWGENNHLHGKMSLRPPFPVEAEVDYENIDLSEMTTLFSRPLPEGFHGVSSGNIKFSGESWKVNADGDITVKDGTIGGLNYDDVTLRFRGVPPYFRLHDSKIRMGMRTFYLDGGINFNKQNIFEDIEATSTEKIVMWRGRELDLKAENQFSLLSHEISRGEEGAKSIGITVKKGKVTDPNDDDDDESNSFVTIGPKFQF